MIKTLLRRILIVPWGIPFSYLFLLPLFWLIGGSFKKELKEVNSFVKYLWNGHID